VVVVVRKRKGMRRRRMAVVVMMMMMRRRRRRRRREHSVGLIINIHQQMQGDFRHLSSSSLELLDLAWGPSLSPTQPSLITRGSLYPEWTGECFAASA
jgi:hypothetical protein